MHDYPDRYEPIRRAREALASANRTLDQQQRDSIACGAPQLANWHGCSSTQAMSTSQFDQWCRDGKPALVARNDADERHLPSVTKSKVDNLVRAAVSQERAHVAEQLEQFAEILGEEVAAIEKKIRSDFNVELAGLRAEVHELRQQQRGGDDILDLPDWRPRHVEH